MTKAVLKDIISITLVLTGIAILSYLIFADISGTRLTMRTQATLGYVMLFTLFYGNHLMKVDTVRLLDWKHLCLALIAPVAIAATLYLIIWFFMEYISPIVGALIFLVGIIFIPGFLKKCGGS